MAQRAAKVVGSKHSTFVAGLASFFKFSKGLDGTRRSAAR
jgi:hypothetical protein